MGLWENAENQPLIGCLIISLTHSLLIEMRAILIIQEAKYKLVYLTRLFIGGGGGGQGGERLPPPVPPPLPPVPFCELSPASRLFSTNLAMCLLLSRPI